MNQTSKITSLTGSNSLSVEHNMYKLLNPKTLSEFQELSNLDKDWKYLDSETDQIYKVYTSVAITKKLGVLILYFLKLIRFCINEIILSGGCFYN